MSEKLYTTEEVAQLAGMKVTSLYYYIRKGELTPYYKDRWQQDRTLLFAEEIVQSFIQKYKRKGLTTGEVAKLLHMTNAQVLSLIDKGLLHAERVSFGKVEWNMIDEAEVERFQKSFQHLLTNEKPFHTKNKQFYIYQLLVEPLSAQYGRLTEIFEDGKDGIVTLSNGYTHQLSELLKKGFQINQKPIARPYSKKHGFIEITTKKPSEISDALFRAIDFLYQYIGTKNMKIVWSEEKIVIRIKPLFIELNIEEKDRFQPVISFLQTLTKNGEMELRHNGLLITNHIESMTLFLEDDMKNELSKQASLQGYKVNDYIVSILKKHLHQN